MSDDVLIQLTSEIVSAHVSNNAVRPDQVAVLIERVFGALSNAANPPVVAEPVKAEPAVSVRASVKPDHVVCLDCGVKLLALKRHLHSHHDTTPTAYRAKWNLPSDYPLVAPNYAEKRRQIALALGLGRKQAPEAVAEPAPAPAEPAQVDLAKAEVEQTEAPTPQIAAKPVREPRRKRAPTTPSE